MKDLINKTVTIHLGTVPGFTDSIKGKVIEVEGEWMKIKTRNTVEIIRQSVIKRITQKNK